MKPVDEHPELRSMVRVLRIIVGFLCVGFGGFLGYLVFLHEWPLEPADELLAWISIALVGSMIPVWVILRFTLVRKARDAYDDDDVGDFRQRYQSATIVLAALIEGPGLFAAIAYMLTESPVALGVACGCLFALLTMIPSEARVNGLLEDAP